MGKAIKLIDNSGSYRVFLAITTDVVEEARKIHNTTPVATAGLGRVLTGAGLMGLSLKNPTDKLTVIFKGDGPAKEILATASSQGVVKGYISNPYVDLPLNSQGKLDVGASLGVGDLIVIKDLGLKEPYMGTISLVDGEIADDLTAYYYISEQQNTAISLGVMVDVDLSCKAAGGMIIQMLPNPDEKAIDELEMMLAELPPITTLITKVMETHEVSSMEEQLKCMADEIFSPMSDEYKVRVLEECNLDFVCDCSFERLEEVLMTIGKHDLEEIIKEDGQAEMVCQFCQKKYHFDKEHLERILEEMK